MGCELGNRGHRRWHNRQSRLTCKGWTRRAGPALACGPRQQRWREGPSRDQVPCPDDPSSTRSTDHAGWRRTRRPPAGPATKIVDSYTCFSNTIFACNQPQTPWDHHNTCRFFRLLLLLQSYSDITTELHSYSVLVLFPHIPAVGYCGRR